MRSTRNLRVAPDRQDDLNLEINAHSKFPVAAHPHCDSRLSTHAPTGSVQQVGPRQQIREEAGQDLGRGIGDIDGAAPLDAHSARPADLPELVEGLLGVFGTTPAGSLNRSTTRLQIDTTFRF